MVVGSGGQIIRDPFERVHEPFRMIYPSVFRSVDRVPGKDERA
jgi:hypothetical protein